MIFESERSIPHIWLKIKGVFTPLLLEIPSGGSGDWNRESPRETGRTNWPVIQGREKTLGHKGGGPVQNPWFWGDQQVG